MDFSHNVESTTSSYCGGAISTPSSSSSSPSSTTTTTTTTTPTIATTNQEDNKYRRRRRKSHLFLLIIIVVLILIYLFSINFSLNTRIQHHFTCRHEEISPWIGPESKSKGFLQLNDLCIETDFSHNNKSRSIEAGTCVRFDDNKIRCFPTFIIAGAMKSGTGAMMNYLNQHPFIESGKNGNQGWNEMHFFGTDSFNHNKCSAMENYIQWFPSHFINNNQRKQKENVEVVEEEEEEEDEGKKIMTFDKTPAYIRNPIALKQISESINNIKIIVMLRNPSFSVYSAFQHHCRHKRLGTIKLTAEEMSVLPSPSPPEVEANKTITNSKDAKTTTIVITSGKETFHLGYSYSPSSLSDQKFGSWTSKAKHGGSLQVLHYPCNPKQFDEFMGHGLTRYNKEELSVGHYDDQISNLLKYFDSSQILIIFHEDMIKDFNTEVRKVEDFINAPCFSYNRIDRKKNKYLSPFDMTTRALDDYFRPRNRKLAKILSETFQMKLPSTWPI